MVCNENNHRDLFFIKRSLLNILILIEKKLT